jgi:L-malate glycosyltransferase
MNVSKKHVLFIHLLNDFSGSPLVLSQVINSLSSEEYVKTVLTTQSAEQGFLSNLADCEYKYYWYRWKKNDWYRLLTYSLSQLHLFFSLFQFWNKPVTVYVNTLLPFGAAWAARIMRKEVIYHVHESSIKPALLKEFLKWTASKNARKAIYVSNYLLEKEALDGVLNLKIYNSLSPEFTQIADSYKKKNIPKKGFVVLMICSLKIYKGVHEFLELARRISTLQFEMVLNSSSDEVQKFKSSHDIPSNLRIYESQTDVHPFYQNASVILNLSHPDKWIETFGMTILEGMYYGLPAIVPEVGGVKELVEDGKNGFRIGVDKLGNIEKRIMEMSVNSKEYVNYSAHSVEMANHFTYSKFKEQVKKSIES